MVTVDTSTVGTGGDYATPELWEAGEKGDWTATGNDAIPNMHLLDEQHEPIFFDSGWTLDATHYIWITCDVEHKGDKTAGAWIEVDDGTAIPQCINMGNASGAFIRVSGVRFTNTKTSGAGNGILLSNDVSILLERALMHDFDGSTSERGVAVSDRDGVTVHIINSIFDTVKGSTSASACIYGNGTSTEDQTVKIYNCTIWNSNRGIRFVRPSGGTKDIDVRNCLVDGSDTSFHTGTDQGPDVWNANCDKNVTSDTGPTDHDVPGTNRESYTFQEGTGSSGNRVMFVDLTGTVDLHLDVPSTPTDNGAIGFGNDLSGVSLLFGVSLTDDVDLQGRSSTVPWEAGADQVIFLTVDAGTDQALSLPGVATLDGTITGAVSQTWSKQGGPGEVQFDDMEAVDTTAAFSTPGVYILRLTATDGFTEAYDELVVTVTGLPETAAATQPILTVQYPRQLETAMVILDGFIPIAEADLDAYQEVARKLEETLGAGWTDAGQNLFGPKSGNASLAERLDRFLDPDGGLHDIAYVTGTRDLGDFSEAGGGAIIPFGKNLSRGGIGPDSYHVLFACKTRGTFQDSGLFYEQNVPALWWTVEKLRGSVVIMARTMDGQAIASGDDTPATFGLLAIGYEAFCTGA